MQDFGLILLYALLPAGGAIAGGLLAEKVTTPRWIIGASLHGAAGIAIGLICIELTPRILDEIPTWMMAAGFSAGAAVSYFMARGVASIRRGASGASFRAWMVYAAIATDLFSDGMMTGAGSAAALTLGLFLALSQFLANIPGGFAAGANLRANGAPRRDRLLAAGILCATAIISCTMGFLVLKDAGQTAQHVALSFVLGILLLATIEDMIPEGDAPLPPRWSSSLAFALGFCALALMTELKSSAADQAQIENDITVGTMSLETN